MNCLVIDDDIVASNLISHYIKQTEGLTLLHVCNGALPAREYLQKNMKSVDLVFLDMEMPDLSGLELLELFDTFPPTIVISAKENYALKAIEHRVLAYLVKPIEYGKFLKATQKAIKEKELTEKNTETNKLQQDALFIKDEGVFTKVPYKNIQYFEALGDYVKVVTIDKTYSPKITLKTVEDKLSEYKNFARVHRSFIVNLHFLENFDYETAIVAQKIIPIGAKYREQLMSILNFL